MEPQLQGQPAERYRARVRRRNHIRRRPKSLLLIAMVAAILLILPVGWMFYYLSHHRPRNLPQQAKSSERRALLAAVNKLLSHVGKDVGPADLAVGTATLHSRDGRLYLIGAVQNRSSRTYLKVHIIFDTIDRNRDPAGVVEGDLSGVAAQKETSFEIGPVSPLAAWWLVRSIKPVE
jgi:hypothetical protein